MHIHDILQRDQTTFSFEFFPPHSDDAADRLFTSIAELAPLRPSFVSVTYGAGGGTRARTHELVMRIKRETSLLPIPHLTCVWHTEAEIYDILERYAEAGLINILALGGDTPRDKPNHDRTRDAFPHAIDLVRFIHAFRARHAGRHLIDPRGFGVGVAGFPEGHPSTPNRLTEMDHLKAKIDSGAHWITTQLFFENRDFYDFRERCDLAGVKVPILAGLMPITSEKTMHRIADLALGARVPARLMRAIQRCGGDQDAVKRVGVHWATEQCRDLLDNQVRGIHFYTLNSSGATREIYANLGVKDSRALAGA